VIGSTTNEEFKQIEKDRALARRLQRIAIEEPSIEETVEILKGLRPRYEEYHQLQFTDGALEAAAKLAARHLRDFKLPDSAIDVIDEAGAVMRLRQTTADADQDGNGSLPAEAPGEAGLRGEAPKAGGLPAEAPKAGSLPAEAPKARRRVDVAHIEEVVARMARIPARQASSSDRERLRTLEESLNRVVFGQEEAVRLVAQSIKRSRAGLAAPDRPAGNFLFTGPTGVGKTELAKQLALLLGNEFIRFDMSEYMEKHAVARLIG